VERALIFSSSVISEIRLSMRSLSERFVFWKGKVWAFIEKLIKTKAMKKIRRFMVIGSIYILAQKTKTIRFENLEIKYEASPNSSKGREQIG
jgi:hypothetical protein